MGWDGLRWVEMVWDGLRWVEVGEDWWRLEEVGGDEGRWVEMGEQFSTTQKSTPFKYEVVESNNNKNSTYLLNLYLTPCSKIRIDLNYLKGLS